MRRKLYESGAEIVNRALDCALLLKRPDGGFASSIRRATPTLEGYTVGLGLPTESDMDGTIIAGQRLRTTMHAAFGIPCSQDYYRPYEAEFWERLKNKPPVVKTLPYLKTAKD
jgi:hypothetical protein